MEKIKVYDDGSFDTISECHFCGGELLAYYDAEGRAIDLEDCDCIVDE